MKVKSIKAKKVYDYKAQVRFTIEYETGRARERHETTFVYDKLTGNAHFGTDDGQKFRYELEEVAEAYVTLEEYGFWKEV